MYVHHDHDLFAPVNIEYNNKYKNGISRIISCLIVKPKDFPLFAS